MRRALVTVAATLCFSAPAHAQAPTGFATLTPQAIADSLVVMDRLVEVTRADPKNHAAHYHLGLVAYTLSERAKLRDTPKSLDWRKLRYIAERAFYTAFDLQPANIEYTMGLGRFTVTGGAVEMIPEGYFRMARKLAVNAKDSAALVEASRALGEMYWKHSEWADDAISGILPSMEFTDVPAVPTRSDVTVEAPRGAAATSARIRGESTTRAAWSEAPSGRLPAIEHNDQSGHLRSLAPLSVMGAARRDSMAPLKMLMASAASRLHDVYKPLPRPEYFYLTGEKYTREAYEMDPGNPKVFRSLAAIMLLRERWKELTELAQEQTRRTPADPMGWLSLGLGLHYQRRSEAAKVAFDSGFARMDPAERKRLDRIERVLGARDSVRYVALDSAGRAQFEKTWWLLNAPLWARRDADPRTEFYARLTYAELRWTWDKYAFTGVDGPPGRHFVRYGLAGQQLGQFTLHQNGLVFSQCMRLLSCTNSDAILTQEIRERFPSTWDNTADARIVEMPASVARFRSSHDSVDILIAARAPLDTLRSSGVANLPVQTWLWLYGWDSPMSVERKKEADGLGYAQWRERVPPGAYYARLESMVEGATVAGRQTATVNLGPDSLGGFLTRGFGISDLIIASSTSSPATPRRWSDFDIAPLLNGVSAGSSISLLWETYELGARNAAADYRVTISIERERSALGRIAARIVQGFDGKVNQRVTSNELSLQFDRRVPFAETLVDNVVLSLATTPPGSYLLRLTVQDAVSGRTMSRVTPLVIVAPKIN